MNRRFTLIRNLLRFSILFFSIYPRAGAAQRSNPPIGSYEKYFKHYIPGSPGMPRGIDTASKALMFISSEESGGGTAFLIWTRRKDRKICACTAQHLLDSIARDHWHRYSLDINMKYLSQPHTQPELGMFDSLVSNLPSTIHPELVARSISSELNSPDGDWALMLLNPQELPLANFSTLGYVFNPAIYATTPAGKFFITGYPNKMSQRFTDSLEYVTDWIRQYSASSPYFILDNPPGKITGMATGASGGPVINNWIASAPAVSIFRGKGYITYSGALDPADMPSFDRLHYFSKPSLRQYVVNGFVSTKMSTPTLMAAIKRHCWPSEDSSEILRTEVYKGNLSISNKQSNAQFDQNRAVTTQAGIAAVADQSFGTSNPGATLIKANLLTINCTITPDADLQVLYGLAKQINLDENFTYTAAGDYYMEMNSIVPEYTGSIAQKARSGITNPGDTGTSTKYPAGFAVYPNPSASGLFNIVCPATSSAYRIAVHSTDGRQVHSIANITVEKYFLNLSTLPRGAYVLSIYQQQTGERIFSKTIVY